MTAVLVTGSAGFLGRAVCALLLERRIKTVGIDPQQSGAAGYQSFADDLSDRKRITEYLAYYGITHIIHCGGVSSPQLATPDRIVAANVGGSLNLALGACAAGVRRFVFASSIAAFDPQNAYGFSKAATELTLQALNTKHATKFCALRFAGIYGPGRSTPVLPHDLVAAALNGKSINVPARSAYACIYIDDAAEAAVESCFAEETREKPYHVAYPERVTAIQLANAVKHLIPSFEFNIAAEASSTTAPHFDIAAATHDFGFSPAIDYKSGLKLLIDWMSSPASPLQRPTFHAKTS